MYGHVRRLGEGLGMCQMGGEACMDMSNGREGLYRHVRWPGECTGTYEG
jgi:hypothetical protein